MAFGELFELQAAFALMRAGIAAEPAEPIPYRQDVIETFKAGLGFELTKAQRRSAWDAFQDMALAVPIVEGLLGNPPEDQAITLLNALGWLGEADRFPRLEQAGRADAGRLPSARRLRHLARPPPEPCV